MLNLPFIKQLSDPIRAGHWWKYKAAHILGFAYLYMYLLKLPLKQSLIILTLSAVTIVGVAGLGYVINDIYDIEPDHLAGKRNRMEQFSPKIRAVIILLLVATTLLPWLYLKSNVWIWLLMGFEIFLFVVYAHPLTRLKERSLWGPICDALYGHAVPVIIACLTYQQYFDEVPYQVLPFFISLLVWQFFKGLRNIFLHQMEDFEGDLAAGVNTFATQIGIDKLYGIILSMLLPLEFVAFMNFTVQLIEITPFIGYCCIVFLLIYILGHGLFRTTETGSDKFKNNTYLYFLNDWYEDYFPWIFAVANFVHHWQYAALAGFHFLMFPETLAKILKDIKEALTETLVFAKKAIYPIYKAIK